VVAPSVVCIGAITLDLVAAIHEPLEDDARVTASEAVIGSGGPAATAAVTLTRLGIPTAFVGTVGNDDAGEFVRRELEREGVETAEVRIADGRTAMSPIVVNRQTAHRSIAAFYGTVGAPVLSQAAITMCRAAEWIHVDHIGYAIVAALRSSGIATQVSVDAGNPIPDLDIRNLDLYAPTESRILERYAATDVTAAMRASLNEGAVTVAVTCGSLGSLGMSRVAAWGADVGSPVHAPAFDVPIYSTLGAGDVFHGALLAARVRGSGLRDALTIANAVASLSCRGLDGRSGIPSWSETIAFIKDRQGSNLTPTEGP
jgi:sulfofructose kinase